MQLLAEAHHICFCQYAESKLGLHVLQKASKIHLKNFEACIWGGEEKLEIPVKIKAS